MKPQLLFILILLAQTSRAQDFEGEASRIQDSLFNRAQHDSVYASQLPNDVDYFFKLHDSLVKVSVTQHVNNLTIKGEYSWPGWYLQHVSMTKRSPDTSIQQPTETGRYLLESKYHISMWGVSNGCVFQQAFVLHDSLMMEAIRKKYGRDFFSAYYKEAYQLDKHSAGLTLPFIKSKAQTATLLDNAFAFVKDLPSEEKGEGRGCYLMFEFEKGKVKSVFVCRRVFYVQQDLSLMSESERLTALAQRLGWTPPKFMNSATAATVIYDMEQRSLSFYKGGTFF